HLNPAFWSYSNHSQKLTEINLNHFFGLKSEYFRFFLRFHEETAFFQKHPHLSVRLFQIFKERLLPFRRRQGCVYYTTEFCFASPLENFFVFFRLCAFVLTAKGAHYESLFYACQEADAKNFKARIAAFRALSQVLYFCRTSYTRR
ncbi:hypothetical protein, partial [Duodenibacillus massiliensis]|uniref:hypothetical protein n=1 Tax=Duodenibacillus massiliensis TaxID=1852381 RepID=UPI003AB892D9